MRTPSSTLVDIATDFGVAVTPDAEEVHVFEGELQRLSKKAAQTGAEPESLKAGVLAVTRQGAIARKSPPWIPRNSWPASCPNRPSRPAIQMPVCWRMKGLPTIADVFTEWKSNGRHRLGWASRGAKFGAAGPKTEFGAFP